MGKVSISVEKAIRCSVRAEAATRTCDHILRKGWIDSLGGVWPNFMDASGRFAEDALSSAALEDEA